MASKINILITGATGRMGRALIAGVHTHPEMILSGALEHPNHPQLGLDVGPVIGLGEEIGVPLSDQGEALIAGADVVIDFSLPEVTTACAALCEKYQSALIIGTTGFSEDELKELEARGQKTPILRAGNMSLGINLLEHLTRQCAELLGEEFDIEIVETHHRLKRDAPSGTALMLGEAAAKGHTGTLNELADYGRHQQTGVRKRGKIGFHAIRGGDVVGEHDVIFAADGERLVLRHIATSREIFARGALRAAQWIKDQPAGSYTMANVFGPAFLGQAAS